jgi:hypothetical protein
MPLAFHRAIHHFLYLITAHFLFEWLLVLLLTVACSAWISAVRRPVYPLSQSNRRRDERDLHGNHFVDGISAGVFVLFAALYIFLIFYKEDFSYYDNSQLTDFSLRGKMFPPPVWWSVGRFFPLGFQEFNILAFFTKSPAGFHSFAVAQLVILVLALFAVLKELAFVYRVLIVIAAMLAPSFAVSFMGLIYPERNVLFWLAVVVFCLYSYSKTKLPLYFVGCLVGTQFALYYKEPVVVFIAAYSLFCVLVESYNGTHAGKSWRQLADENSLALGMLALSGIYAIFFALTMFPFHSFSYVAESRRDLGSLLLTYIQTDWLPCILLILVGIRIQRIIFADGECDPLWEPLAVGALAYFFVLIALGLASAYYTAPVDLITFLYGARVVLPWVSKAMKLRIAVAAAFSCLVLHNAAYSTFRIVERKGVIAAKSRFADFLEDYIATANGKAVKLYFPYANGYHLMELSAYLRYRGFNMVREGIVGDDAGSHVFIEGRQEFPHNRCIDDKDYVCIHANQPKEADLIVVLPDDIASMQDVGDIGNHSALLFAFDACEMRAKCGRLLRLLYTTSHAISAGVSGKELPEHFLQLHVYKQTSPVPSSSLEHASIPDTSGQRALSP